MRGEGSPDVLALATLCCSPALPDSSHSFPLLSFPPLVISLAAKCTLPQELPCSCFVSFLSPQASSPSVVQFQPASGSSCGTSLFTLTLLPPAHRSRSNPNTHTIQTPHQLLSPLQSSLGFQFPNLKQKTKSYCTVRGSHREPPLQWPCLQKTPTGTNETGMGQERRKEKEREFSHCFF